MSPGRTYLPAASITRSAGGRSASGPTAAIAPSLIATAASTTSDAVTTRPPRISVSTPRVAAPFGMPRLIDWAPAP